MGIKGLRAALAPNQLRPGHVKEFSGQVLAIDAFAWLHRGAFSCALELATGQPTTRHIDYCLHLIAMLQHYGVTPIAVLDGAPLPGKANVNSERSEKRRENLTKGLELMDMGKRFEAEQSFQRAISITAEMANQLQHALLDKGVQCFVAPFEADAQMAHLVKQGLASAVITEDSDMLPYGIETVVYKMDKYGNCSILDSDSILGLDAEKPIFRIPASQEKRLHVCILAGCDYLASVPGIGIAKALALVNKWNTGPRAIKELRRQNKAVPDDYEKLFRRAEITFRCHWVYDPASKQVVHLSPLPTDSPAFSEEVTNPQEFLGKPLSEDVAERVCAKGLLHAATLKPFPEWKPKKDREENRSRSHSHSASQGGKGHVANAPHSSSGKSFGCFAWGQQSGSRRAGNSRGVGGGGSGAGSNTGPAGRPAPFGSRGGGGGGSGGGAGGIRSFLGKQKAPAAELGPRPAKSICGIIPEGGVADLLRDKARARTCTAPASMSSPSSTPASATSLTAAAASASLASQAPEKDGRHASSVTTSSASTSSGAGFLMAWINSADDASKTSPRVASAANASAEGRSAAKTLERVSATPATIKKKQVGPLDSFFIEGPAAKEPAIPNGEASGRDVHDEEEATLDGVSADDLLAAMEASSPFSKRKSIGCSVAAGTSSSQPVHLTSRAWQPVARHPKKTTINKNAKGIKSGKGARIGGVGGASGGARRGLGGSGAPKRPVTSGSLDAFVVYEL